MINTILIGKEPRHLESLKEKIEQCCPSLDISGTASSMEVAQYLLQNQTPDLTFVNPAFAAHDIFTFLPEISSPRMEIIFITNSPAYVHDAIYLEAAGYLFWPMEESTLIASVTKASRRIRACEEENNKNLLMEKLLKEKILNELISIPTIEGYEFISVREIIHCERIQKCTRIVTDTQKDIFSSYNIGKFIRLLSPYGFFSPHKSHLINPAFIKKYLREGTIILKNNSFVPVSKRRKCEFLKRVVHF